jgi:transcriptional regulator with XRE-family HTH domain
MPAVNGAEIRRRRQRLGIKLGPFSERSGVKYKTLANIECGAQRSVSIEVIYLIAAALGLTDDETADLLEDEAAALWPLDSRRARKHWSGTARPEM